MNQLNQSLFERLEEKGVEKNLLPGFLRSLANTISNDPQMGILQVNERLHWLGWDDFELDYHTLQLAIASFENEGMNSLEGKPTRWLDNYIMGNNRL